MSKLNKKSPTLLERTLNIQMHFKWLRMLFFCQFFFAFSLLFPLSMVAASNVKDSVQSNAYSKLYKLDTFRAMQGTIQISQETKIKKNLTVNLSLMGTYASTRGLARPYLSAQSFVYQDHTGNLSYSLNDLQMIGYGINFQLRKYLGKKSNQFKGFYSASEIFFRQLFLESSIIDRITLQPKDIKQQLYLGYIGHVVGYQKIIRDVVCLDFYLGGGFFYSQYAGENKPVHYHSNYQIDFTGFFFNSGVMIGITH